MKLKAVGLFIVARARWAVSLGAQFWFFMLGLAMAGYGASLLHPCAGWLLAGLILVWDATRVDPPNPPLRR